jgi:hypothetical protein
VNERTKNLKGSPKRDIFKWAHKNKMNAPSFYASDCDLCIVSFNPRGVVAYFDYKGSGESITPSETVLYDEWAKAKPVFIVEGTDPENGPFTVSKYISGIEPTEDVCTLKDWSDFLKWEASLRLEYSKSQKVVK